MTRLPFLPLPAVLPRLEGVLATLDRLLEQGQLSRLSGGTLTDDTGFFRDLERAASELDGLCEELREAGHE